MWNTFSVIRSRKGGSHSDLAVDTTRPESPPPPFQGEKVHRDFSELGRQRFGSYLLRSQEVSWPVRCSELKSKYGLRIRPYFQGPWPSPHPHTRGASAIPRRPSGRAISLGGRTYGTGAGIRQDRGSACAGHLWNPRRKAFCLQQHRESRRLERGDSSSLGENSGVTLKAGPGSLRPKNENPWGDPTHHISSQRPGKALLSQKKTVPLGDNLVPIALALLEQLCNALYTLLTCTHTLPSSPITPFCLHFPQCRQGEM